MIKVILWDIDGTLLDFGMAEKYAIRKCFSVYGLGTCTDEMLVRYSAINRRYWERLERCELTREQVLVGRFREFFESEGLQTDCAEAFNQEYQVRLGDQVFFRDNGYELVNRLKSRVRQYAVTNGTVVAQERKLKQSGLDQVFDGIFISEKVGTDKPNQGFFDAVWKEIGVYEPQEVMIIGDSLTSDIKGGNQAGILCCWYNPHGSASDGGLRIDWEIRDLNEVEAILEQMEEKKNEIVGD